MRSLMSLRTLLVERAHGAFELDLSGTMFDRLPPVNRPTVTTAGASVMLTVRLMIVCSAITICEPITIGSMPPHGTAPCVWRPSP